MMEPKYVRDNRFAQAALFAVALSGALVLNQARNEMARPHISMALKTELTQRLMFHQNVIDSRIGVSHIEAAKDSATHVVCYRRDDQQKADCNDGTLLILGYGN